MNGVYVGILEGIEMKYFIKWHSKRFNHSYEAQIEAENIESAKRKFFDIYKDDAIILRITVNIDCGFSDGMDNQKGFSSSFNR